MLDFRIETFLTVCQTMNFTRAAELLHITQPAVSQHIHTLEAQFGAKLFAYAGKQLTLTPAGHLVLQTATTMRHDVHRLQELLRQQSTRRRLCFGVTLTIGEYVMPEPLIRLLRQEPDTQIRMHVANTADLLHLLDEGAIDFAVVEGFFPQQEYDSLPYRTERYVAVCAPDYPFAAPPRCLEDLLGERLLTREPGSGTREVLERVLREHNRTVDDFRALTELGSLDAIKSLTRAGLGIAFFYEPAVRTELTAGTLRELTLEGGSMTHDFTFLWRRGSVFAGWYREIFSHLLA